MFHCFIFHLCFSVGFYSASYFTLFIILSLFFPNFIIIKFTSIFYPWFSVLCDALGACNPYVVKLHFLYERCNIHN